MASRYFQQFTSSYDRFVVFIDGNVTLNGSSAPSALTGSGCSTFVRTSTGVYTLTLTDQFYKFLFGTSSFTTVTSIAGLSDLTVGIIPNVYTSSSSGLLQSVVFTFVNDSGAVTDPAAGTGLQFLLFVKNTMI